MLPPPPPCLEPWEEHFAVAPSAVLYKDPDVVIFRDRQPRASVHLLAVPRHRRIRGVESLTPADIPLLHAMSHVAARLAGPTATPVHIGFHQWPLRSVHHLHLHYVVPPFTARFQRRRFTELRGSGTPPRVGFISLASVLARLAPSAAPH